MPSPVLDVVIPVYNEEGALAACVRRLDAHLAQTFPYPYRITIADNASTDRTWQVAQGLAERYPTVRPYHLDRKGRGRALKEVWGRSDATVLAYLDVDLSTDLDALWPLVAPLMSGHSDLAIGSRLSPGSRVVRQPFREFTSQSYNLVLRAALGVRFSDAQCGFKAIRADVARDLLPWAQDTSWFFDTELLVLAERCRLRIHEVPVDWYDDPDSRVDVAGTARDDLAGVLRLRRALARGAIPVDDLAVRIGRGRLGNSILGQAGRFAGVGAASTVLNLAAFAALHAAGVAGQVANVLALIVATLWNTAANRRFTFGVRTRRGWWRHQAVGLALFGLAWASSAFALWVLGWLAPHAPVAVATAVVGTANLVATLAKFVVFRQWLGEDTAADARFVPEETGPGLSSAPVGATTGAAGSGTAPAGQSARSGAPRHTGPR